MMTEVQKKEILEMCNVACKNTLMETLDISYTDVGDDCICICGSKKIYH